MSWPEVAEGVARAAHSGQVDLAGKPYITHVARVVERVQFCGDDVVAVAWLHDVVEDTDVTIDQIREAFPPEIAAGVDAMTQRENEPLESYWARVKANELAFIVKLHGDMPDNNDPTRPGPTEAQRIRIRSKYARAIRFFAQQGPTQCEPPCKGDAKSKHRPQDGNWDGTAILYDQWHKQQFGKPTA